MGCSSSHEVKRRSARSSGIGTASLGGWLSSGTPTSESVASRRISRISRSSEVRSHRRTIRISEATSPGSRIVADQLTLDVNFAYNFSDNFRLDAKIGHGKFAEVRSITSLFSGADYDKKADKKPKCAKLLDVWDGRGKECPVLVEVAAMEVHIAQMVGHHPNVVETCGAYKQEGTIILVMETCDRNLGEYMNDVPDINDTFLGDLVFQMLCSLHHLHFLRVVHRDVKPENFLLRGHTLKLCDFGLAAILPDYGMLCTPAGTAPYMPPEMYEGFWYNETADIWSLAVTIYVLLFGTFPYESKDGTTEGMRKAIVEGDTPTFEPEGRRKAPETCALVRALLARKADRRPSSEKALNFPSMVTIARASEYNSASKGVTPQRQAMKSMIDEVFENPGELQQDAVLLSKPPGRFPTPSTNSASPLSSPRSSAPTKTHTSPWSPCSRNLDEIPTNFSL